MATQRDVKNRIASVKNIEKITRAMEMVAAARLRRAEQRIAALRPYADALRRMTRQAAEAAGAEVSTLPVLAEHEREQRVALLLVTGDRGLAGAFNSQIVRAGVRAGRRLRGRRARHRVVCERPPRRLVADLPRARGGRQLRRASPIGPPTRTRGGIADDLITAYVDGEIDRVEVFYNGYISPLTQKVRRETLLPLAQASILEGDDGDEDDEEGQDSGSGGDRASRDGKEGKHALVEYEPDPEEILRRLVPDYVEISIYRALLESTASEHGARMTAMRSASENAGEIIDRPDPGDEPGAPGRDHPGDHGGRRRRRDRWR